MALAAVNMAPRGYKISGYVIKDTKTGNAMLSRGKGDKQEQIRNSINKYAEMRGTIDFVLFLDGKTEDDNKEITKRYEWDSNEAVEIPVK